MSARVPPCHKKPQAEWCDSMGPGGFMGHTCGVHWGDPGSKVTRKTQGFVFSAGKGRHVIVTVYCDGGLIGLRLSKHRREEYVYAADIYRMAVVSRVSAERAAKKKARKF